MVPGQRSGRKQQRCRRGHIIHAVDDVSFTIDQGQTLGIVGESGCGKSTTGRAILRLIEPTSGEIFFDQQNIRRLNKRDLRIIRQKMQIIFQDPFSSLDPRQSIFATIEEPLKLHKNDMTKNQRRERVHELMDLVGLAARLEKAYPHELDGGRRQRVGIARALASDPEFILCDEPVSALDVSIQAQILNLLSKLQEQLGLTYIFVTHNLSVVNHFSDDILVMYLGRQFEKAPAEELFSNPMHPYTEALLSAIPVPDIHHVMNRIILKGEITSPINPKSICRFANRCQYAFDRCRNEEPKLSEITPKHFVACFRCEGKSY